MRRWQLAWRVGTGLFLCLGLGSPAHADAAYPRAGLLDLAPQTYRVDPPARLTPVPPPEPGALPDAGVERGEHVQYGLLPLQGLTPYRYGSAWTNRWVDGTGAVPVTVDRIAPLASTGVDAWARGARNWQYVSSLGYGLTVGNTAAPTVAWSSGDPVRLAGVGLYTTVPVSGGADSDWRYSVAAGALDLNGDGNVASGGLDYGPVAYDAASSYALNSDLSVASRVQGTQGLTAVGLGGEYALDQWGSWALGVSHAAQSSGGGWGYQLGYQVDLPHDLDLSWTNETRGAGYSDLSTYNVALGCHCVRNQWQLSLPVGRWGKVSGTYEQLDRDMGGLERRVGLAQSFQYGPLLNISLEANRNLLSGDYGLGALFSVPLD